MIKILREYLGFSQQQMAMYIGISRSHLSMIESGRRMLSDEKNSKLVKIFLTINAFCRANDSSIDERPLGITETLVNRYNYFFNLQLITYTYRLWKVEKQLRRLENGREKNAKRFMRLEMLEDTEERIDQAMPGSLYPPPLPAFDKELLSLQIKKCSYEAVLRFLEEEKKRQSRF